MAKPDDDKAAYNDEFNKGIIFNLFYVKKDRRASLITEATPEERDAFVKKQFNNFATIFIGIGCMLMLLRRFLK